MFTDTQKEALAAPLARAHVKERTQAGRQLSYIEGWVAIAEANRIFGFDGWSRETILLQETNRELVTLKATNGGTYQQWRVGYLAKVRVLVQTEGDPIIREGTGFGSGMSKPEALGEAVESAAKEAETDAMKRALMTFGNPFGLALYDKTQENVEGSAQNGSSHPPAGRTAPSLVSGGDVAIKRLTSARAKEIGLDAKIKGLIDACASVAALDIVEGRFDKLTEEAPVSWLDSVRNMIALKREELAANDGHRAMDDEYKAVVA